MATPVLNNGIFLRDTNIQVSSNIDSYHLLNNLGDVTPMDMGVVELWAQMQKVEMPLYRFADFDGKNTILVDNPKGEYTWKTAISIDLPFIVEDLDPSNTTKGVDGQNFRIKLSRREFGHGDIISYDKMNGLELYITDDDIIITGDNAIYTVRLVNNNSAKFLGNEYLKSGTTFFRKTSARGEYGELYSTINVQAGFREYYNYVGNSEAHVQYQISSRADLMIRGGMNSDGTVPVTQIWKLNNQNAVDPSITNLNQMANVMGKDWVKKATDNGDLSMTFLTNLEAAHVRKIGMDIENNLMWGHGGFIDQNGADAMRLSVGLWKQLDSAYKYIYTKSNFTLDIFRNQLLNFFQGKVEFSGPDPERTLMVQTGIGGMQMINRLIANEASASGFIIQGAEACGVGAVTGKGMNLGFGYAYTSFIVPFLGRLVFQLNPSFDNVQTNEIENPKIDGFPLSSYSFIIYDVTEGNDNIYLLKKSWDNQLRWHYINGSMDYMGRTAGFASAGSHNGYIVRFSQSHPAVWVKDPTKILKIVMKNPRTGFAL